MLRTANDKGQSPMDAKKHFAVLDGLRGIAALMVLIFHVTQTRSSGLPQAALAVDFFFLLSGFVVANAYEVKLQSTLSFASFVRIRLTRLYPLIFFGTSIGIALTVLHLRILDDISTTQVILGAILGLVLLPSYVYPQWDSAYPMNPPSWSLFFEIIINVAYALTVRYLNTARLILLTALGALALVYISFSTGELQAVGASKAGFWLGFGRVLFPFAAGVLLWRFRRPVRYAPYLGWMLPVSLAALLLLPLHQSPALDLIYVILLFPVVVRLGAHVSVGPRTTRAFLFAGRMSYPVYIIHQPFLRAFAKIEAQFGLSGFALCVLEVVVCLVAGYIAMRFFDEPLRAMLNKSVRPYRSGLAQSPVRVAGPGATIGR
jgi:peptidoglycan/LPS O-acetylase OafA/YrhL